MPAMQKTLLYIVLRVPNQFKHWFKTSLSLMQVELIVNKIKRTEK